MEKMEVDAEVQNAIHIERDAVGIWKHMQYRRQLLSNKRLYLMGLSTRASFDKKSALPESFLRKDDVFYEDVTNLVEKCFEGSNIDAQQCIDPDDVQIVGLHNISRYILTLLDDFSNNGLYNLAKLLTRGVVTFVKTRSQMKRVVKTSLLAILSKQYHSNDQASIENGLSQLLKIPENFRKSNKKHVKFTLKSHSRDIMKVLKGLEDLKYQTLAAMHRKLKGTKTKSLRLHSRPSRSLKEELIERVRKLSLDMIEQLGESDELQEPLVKAMAIAGLSSSVASGSQDLSLVKFLRAAPRIKTLQDEILRAIRLLDQRTRKETLSKLGHLLDPNFKAEGKSLKSAIRNLFTEYLFECIDMDVVPESLLGALSFINKKPTQSARGSLSKDLVNDNVECILNLSAYLKQLLWESYPIDQLDQEFVDAYMDEAEESDDGDIFSDSDDDQQLLANFTDEEVGSTGYVDDACLVSPSPKREANSQDINGFAFSKLADDACSDTEFGQGEILVSTSVKYDSSLVTPGFVDGLSRQDFSRNTANLFDTDENENTLRQNVSGHQRNGYVAIQEVCDNASVVAFELIGHVLSKFAQLEASSLDENEESYLRGGSLRSGHIEGHVANSTDGDVSGSILIEAVHEVLPSFSKRELETVKKFMSF